MKIDFEFFNPSGFPCICAFQYLIFSLTGLTFDSVDSAKRAKDALSGADIYSGCCTLKIDFAKVTAHHNTTCFYFYFNINKKWLLFVSRIKRGSEKRSEIEFPLSLSLGHKSPSIPPTRFPSAA